MKRPMLVTMPVCPGCNTIKKQFEDKLDKIEIVDATKTSITLPTSIKAVPAIIDGDKVITNFNEIIAFMGEL